MYLEKIPENTMTTTLVKISYDCCGKEHTLKWRDADKNFEKNGGKHICRPCKMRMNNPARRADVKEKTKQTNLERYGSTTAMNSKENIAARNEKMFGSQEVIDARTEKTKKTNLERYGVEHAAQSEEKKQKTLETFRRNYGKDHPLQNEEVKGRVRRTCQERFGYDNPLSSPEIRLKGAQTTLETYGVEHYNQLPEMREYLRNNCKDWLAESYAAGGPNKGIKRPKEWNEKQRATVRTLIESGNWAGGFASNFKGRFPAWRCVKEKPRFLSMLEAKFHLFLNTNTLVEWYDYEGLVLEYKKLDGTYHDYYVDFQVKYYGDDVKHNYEVKAYQNKDKFDTQLKYDTAIDYCSANNMTYTMLFESDIDKLGISDDAVRSLPGIELYERH